MLTRISINGIDLNSISYNELLEYIIKMLEKKDKSCLITYLNAYIYCLAKTNIRLRNIINSSDLVVADGISMTTAGLLFSGNKIIRCIMTKAFDRFLYSTNTPVCKGILIGTTDAESRKAMENINITSLNFKIIESYSGFHSQDFYSEILKTHRNTELVLIGMSSPVSEYLCKTAQEICSRAVIWHIGGGTIKCYAGSKNRAPEWISVIGMEWLHRLLFEKHTRNRYLIYNIVFLYLIITGLFRNFLRKINFSDKSI